MIKIGRSTPWKAFLGGVFFFSGGGFVKRSQWELVRSAETGWRTRVTQPGVSFGTLRMFHLFAKKPDLAGSWWKVSLEVENLASTQFDRKTTGCTVPGMDVRYALYVLHWPSPFVAPDMVWAEDLADGLREKIEKQFFSETILKQLGLL